MAIENLGQNIKKYREKKGMTQAELEGVLGSATGSVHRWEHSLMTPSVYYLYQLALTLCCSVDELLDIPTSNLTVNSPKTVELYDKAFDTYGVENQLHVAIEEMSELTKEITKVLRSGELWNPTAGIVEEIADVMIITEELLELFGCIDDVYRMRLYKLKRLEDNLRKDGVEIG